SVGVLGGWMHCVVHDGGWWTRGGGGGCPELGTSLWVGLHRGCWSTTGSYRCPSGFYRTCVCSVALCAAAGGGFWRENRGAQRWRRGRCGPFAAPHAGFGGSGACIAYHVIQYARKHRRRSGRLPMSTGAMSPPAG